MLDTQVPNELIIKILGYVLQETSFKQLFKLCRTCKRWNELIPYVIKDGILKIQCEDWRIEIGTRFGKEYWQYFNTKFCRNLIYDDQQKTIMIDITKYQKAFSNSKTRREEDSKENSRKKRKKRKRRNKKCENKLSERISVKDKIGEIKIIFSKDSELIKFENWKVKAEEFFKAVDGLNQTL
ncbi:hypothetical protein Glove_40g93 [Diversispora epigaea]|uniref:F-box domain-containing protein n=1 Tax=Diversispora epigaea TaxID=1348612 RepID=A0A397JJW3_9GLOM|nr:hypothetical protein Glove_40g93 [Diversispora epigaea]